MISYETCVQLKKSGYPFTGAFGIDSNEPPSTPSLSELIEAIGQDFIALARSDSGDEWKAMGSPYNGSPIPVGQKDSIAATPEEAVANLWLTLNQK